MIRSELDALIQGALDNALTAEEQARLAKWISESPDAHERVAQLAQLATLIESLGPAQAPPSLVDDVLAEVTHRPYAIPQSTFPRGVAVNKKILFGLAAAAAIVLAVITYNSNPPATVGTEATIGAAQRAQTPQIAAQDVKLGDTSTQDVLQTETFDAMMKDESLRDILADAEVRAKLTDSALKTALSDNSIRVSLRDTADLSKKLEDSSVKAALAGRDLVNKVHDANMKVLLQNKAIADAFRDTKMRQVMLRPGAARALASDAFLRAIHDTNFNAAMNSPKFAEQMARWARSNARTAAKAQ